MKLRVQELKTLLEKCNPDAEVLIQMEVGCCGDREDLTVSDTEVMDLASSAETREGKSDVHALICVFPVDGYHSCRQVGTTKTDHVEYWKAGKSSVSKRKDAEE